MQVRPYQPEDEEAVVSLWQRCEVVRPWNDPRKDIQRKLRVRPDLFLVGLFDGQIVASVMAGYEGHRGWLNYLVVAPEHQRRGLGRAIVREAERLLREADYQINDPAYAGVFTQATNTYIAFQNRGNRDDGVVPGVVYFRDIKIRRLLGP
jgi:ribosomal protein S18 acetylase RimI-like enzyme